MGQRIQIIFKIPEIYYNDNNPNNEPERILVYHNQWLFGANFLKYMSRLIKAIKHNFEYYKEYGYTYDYNDIINNAIKYSNNADIDYLTNTHSYEGDGFDWNKDLKDSESILKFLNILDNNNGYMYIEITKDNKILYDILNGYEDAENIESRTPHEFLNLFYTDAEIINKLNSGTIEAIQYLNEYKKVFCFKQLEHFKTELNQKPSDKLVKIEVD